MPVGGKLCAAFAKRLHLRCCHRTKAARDCEVLSQHLKRINAADRRRNRKSHRVSQSLFDRPRALLDALAAASQTLHTERAHSAMIGFGQNLLLETSIRCVERVQRHLNSVELDSVLVCELKHLEMYR